MVVYVPLNIYFIGLLIKTMCLIHLWTQLFYYYHHYLRNFVHIAHDAMGGRIDYSWGGPIELFLVPASDPRLV